MKKLIILLIAIPLFYLGCCQPKPTGQPDYALAESLKARLNTDLNQCGLKPLNLSKVELYFTPSSFISNQGNLANGECIVFIGANNKISLRTEYPEIKDVQLYVNFVHEVVHCQLGFSGHDDTHINLMQSTANRGLVDYFYLNHPKKCEFLSEYFK